MSDIQSASLAFLIVGLTWAWMCDRSGRRAVKAEQDRMKYHAECAADVMRRVSNPPPISGDEWKGEP